jgi:hypothetical protein
VAGVKKRDRKALFAYIRSTADEMGLRDWEIRLSDEPAREGKGASVGCVFGRKFASPEDQRDTIVHELIHLHLEPASDMVYRDLEKILGRPADAAFTNGFDRQLEYAIDGLAGALAQHTPLIEWPKGPSLR